MLSSIPLVLSLFLFASFTNAQNAAPQQPQENQNAGYLNSILLQQRYNKPSLSSLQLNTQEKTAAGFAGGAPVILSFSLTVPMVNCDPAPRKAPEKPLAFGGLFTNPFTCADTVYNNPLTGAATCPHGFAKLCARCDNEYFFKNLYNCERFCGGIIYQCVSSEHDEKKESCGVPNFGGITMKCIELPPDQPPIVTIDEMRAPKVADLTKSELKPALLQQQQQPMTRTLSAANFEQMNNFMHNAGSFCGKDYTAITFKVFGNAKLPPDVVVVVSPLLNCFADIDICVIIACYKSERRGEFGGMFATSVTPGCEIGNPETNNKVTCLKGYRPVQLTTASSFTVFQFQEFIARAIDTYVLTPCQIAIYYCVNECLLPKGLPGEKGEKGEAGPHGKCGHDHSIQSKILQDQQVQLANLRNLIMSMAAKSHDKASCNRHDRKKHSSSSSSKSHHWSSKHHDRKRRHVTPTNNGDELMAAEAIKTF